MEKGLPDCEYLKQSIIIELFGKISKFLKNTEAIQVNVEIIDASHDIQFS